MSVHVTSEIGQLRSVIVHTPGAELLAVTPSTREDYLYDDIIGLDAAQREHRRFVAVLERFTEVHHVRDLCAQVLADPKVREEIIRDAMDVVSSEPVARELSELPTQALVQRLIQGHREPPGPLARALMYDSGFALPPIPNLFFTRDVAMAVGEHVLIGSMRYGVRWTEELVMKALFRNHPLLSNAGILYDGSVERRVNYTLEGGDVHPLRHDLVMIGFSERSSPAAIDHIAALLFENTAIQDIVVVVMPKENTAIHLDMIFTQVDREACVVYPPHFLGVDRLSVLRWHRGSDQLHEERDIFSALRACGMPMEPIKCGGDERIVQEREQWASGCNFVALRPGLVLSYARNEATLEQLRRAGFRIVHSVRFLTGDERIGNDERAVIVFEGDELVRGGGGPRCMTCPVRRDDV